MEKVGIVTNLGDLDFITIPKKFRENLNLQENDEVELFLAEDSGKKILCIRKLK